MTDCLWSALLRVVVLCYVPEWALEAGSWQLFSKIPGI